MTGIGTALRGSRTATVGPKGFSSPTRSMWRTCQVSGSSPSVASYRGLQGVVHATQGRADEILGLTVAELDEGRWGGSRLRWLTGSERDAAWASI